MFQHFTKPAAINESAHQNYALQFLAFRISQPTALRRSEKQEQHTHNSLISNNQTHQLRINQKQLAVGSLQVTVKKKPG